MPLRLRALLLTPLLVLASPWARAEDTKSADDDDKCAVAVLDLQAVGLPEEAAHVPRILTDTVATELSENTDCKVITQADIAAMLDFEAQKAACGVDSVSCLAEIGGALGVGRVVTGSIGKLGSSFTLQLKLVDISKAEVQKRVDTTVSGEVERLRVAAKAAAREVWGLAPLAGLDDAAPSGDAASSGGALGSPLLWAGGALVGVGAAAGMVGGVGAFLADQMLGTPSLKAADKEAAMAAGPALFFVGVGGGAATLVGAGLMGFALVE